MNSYSVDEVFEETPTNYYKLCRLIASLNLPSIRLFKEFREALESSGRIICVGTGRSGDVADVLAKFLRNIGFYSYGPEELPYTFNPKDLVVAFSGSGSTPYTLETVKFASKLGVKTVGFTSNLDSPLARLLDLVFYVPGAPPRRRVFGYEAAVLAGVYSSPLLMLGGTLFELRSLFLALSFVGYLLLESSPYQVFQDLISLCLSFNPNPDQLKAFYTLMPKPRSVRNPFAGKTVIVGEGFSGIVGRFFTTRLRHCAHPDEERVCFYWRDRGSVALKPQDLTVIISGSGEGIPAVMAKIARKKNCKVVAVTSYVDSTLARLSDTIVYIPGRILQRIEGLRGSYLPRDPRYSAFELRTLITLEAFIQAVARLEGLTESDIWAHHSDFL